MARTAKIRQAASLFILGDNQTGRRVTSLSELSRLTGCSQDYLRQVKASDDWEGQAVRYAEECRLSPGIGAGDVMAELVKDRAVLAHKARELRKRVESLPTSDPSFERVFGLWEKVNRKWGQVSGLDALLEANRVREVEVAKLKARAEVDEGKRREDELKRTDGREVDVTPRSAEVNS